MKNKNTLIAGIVVFFLMFQFGIKPYLYKRDSLRKMNAVLSFWKEGSVLDALYYFENKTDSLPIYILSSYTIKTHKIQKERNERQAIFTVTLTFPDNNIFPSGKDWKIVMSDRAGGWKITSMTIIKN